MRSEGQTAMFVSRGGKVIGIVGVADPIKANADIALKALHEDGIRVVMVTGDNRTTADAVARKLGIDEVHAEILPEGKLRGARSPERQCERADDSLTGI